VEALIDSLARVWFLGVALVGVAVYAVTIKTRLDYLEKDHDRQIHALWEHVNRLIAEKSGE
jgi:hypothetical protein